MNCRVRPAEPVDLQEVQEPVSYTHLDVYKRQGYVGLRMAQ